MVSANDTGHPIANANGGFLKWGYPYPKMDGLSYLEGNILLKWMTWGYSHFKKPPDIYNILSDCFATESMAFLCSDRDIFAQQIYQWSIVCLPWAGSAKHSSSQLNRPSANKLLKHAMQSLDLLSSDISIFYFLILFLGTSWFICMQDSSGFRNLKFGNIGIHNDTLGVDENMWECLMVCDWLVKLLNIIKSWREPRNAYSLCMIMYAYERWSLVKSVLKDKVWELQL